MTWNRKVVVSGFIRPSTSVSFCSILLLITPLLTHYSLILFIVLHITKLSDTTQDDNKSGRFLSHHLPYTSKSMFYTLCSLLQYHP